MIETRDNGDHKLTKYKFIHAYGLDIKVGQLLVCPTNGALFKVVQDILLDFILLLSNDVCVFHLVRNVTHNFAIGNKLYINAYILYFPETLSSLSSVLPVYIFCY